MYLAKLHKNLVYLATIADTQQAQAMQKVEYVAGTHAGTGGMACSRGAVVLFYHAAPEHANEAATEVLPEVVPCVLCRQDLLKQQRVVQKQYAQQAKREEKQKKQQQMEQAKLQKQQQKLQKQQQAAAQKAEQEQQDQKQQLSQQARVFGTS